jgi:hypothetical protein
MDISQIQDVTDSLALMPDAALQKYAMMNKDDPYVMSLAMSESSRRKKMRAAQQGQAGQMPQPKVVDQAIQAINPPPQRPMMPQQAAPQQPPQGMPQAQGQLPEQQGIAQLPAPNMQGMADGGIVGYADRGLVRGQNESFEEYRQRVLKSGQIPGVESPYYTKTTDDRDALVAQANEERARRIAANQLPTKSPYVTNTADLTKVPPPAAATPPVVKPAALPPTGAEQGRGAGITQIATKPTTVSAPLADRLAAEAKAKTGVAVPSQRTAAADAGISSLVTDPTKAAQQLSDIQAAQKIEVPPELQKKIDDYGYAKRAALNEEEAQRQKDVEAMGTAFSDREAKLKAKQGRIEAQEKDLGPMALMQAGFAMMSGTSPYALANIGAGATIGMKSYQEGLDKIESAKDKLDDAFGRIEEYRRNEQMLNAKDKRKAVREIGDTFAEAEKMGVSAIEKSWGVSRDDARTIYSGIQANQRDLANQSFTAGQNALDRSSRERSAAISAQVQKEIAAMPGATERFYGTLGGGNTPSQVKKGFEYFTAATAEGKGNEAIIQAVMKTPEILSTVSPELRKAIEAEVMKRFPQVQDKPGSRP